MTEAVEMCPYCMSENTYPDWDAKKQGFVARCKKCGRAIMLCDECYHSDDNKAQECDWHAVIGECGEEGHCFRGITINKIS